MAAKIYDKIPIVDTARRCGLVLDSRTLRRKEVEASCPFCGDHGPGKYHLSLNTDTDQYRCNLCGAHGNSVSLYARIKGICNKEAYLELAHESKVYPLPQSPSPQTQERQPCSLEQRHAVYSDTRSMPPSAGRSRRRNSRKPTGASWTHTGQPPGMSRPTCPARPTAARSWKPNAKTLPPPCPANGRSWKRYRQTCGRCGTCGTGSIRCCRRSSTARPPSRGKSHP